MIAIPEEYFQELISAKKKYESELDKLRVEISNRDEMINTLRQVRNECPTK